MTENQEGSTAEEPNIKRTILNHQLTILSMVEFVTKMREELLLACGEEGEEPSFLLIAKQALEEAFQDLGDLLKNQK